MKSQRQFKERISSHASASDAAGHAHAVRALQVLRRHALLERESRREIDRDLAEDLLVLRRGYSAVVASEGVAGV